MATMVASTFGNQRSDHHTSAMAPPGTDRRFAAPSEPGQLTEGHQKRPVPCLVLAATAGFRKGYRVGLRIVLFEACSAFTRVTACTLALSPYIVTR